MPNNLTARNTIPAVNSSAPILIAKEVKQILQGTSSDIIEELFILGGSSGGARPKVFVGYNTNTGDLIHGLNNLSEGYDDWIIKFPSSSDNPEIANIEFAYHKMD